MVRRWFLALRLPARRRRPRRSRFDAVLLAALRHRRRGHHSRRAPAARCGGSCRCWPPPDRSPAPRSRSGWACKIGEQGSNATSPPKRLARVRAGSSESGAIALAVLDLIPPPFPFTPFVLAAGALEVKRRRSSSRSSSAGCFASALEAALAVVYGRRILSWLDSDLFHDIVMFVIARDVLTCCHRASRAIDSLHRRLIAASR